MMSDYAFIQRQIVKVQAKIDEIEESSPWGPVSDNQYTRWLDLQSILMEYQEMIGENE